MPAAPIGSRSGSVSVWTGRQMIVWGGSAGGTRHTDGAAYTPATRTWTRIPSAPLPSRSNPNALWTGSRVIVWGGERGDAQLTDGAMYDPVARTWTAMAPAPPLQHSGPARDWVPVTAAESGGRVIRLSLDQAFAATQVQAEAFDPATNTWSGLPSIPLTPVNNYTGVTGATVDGQFVVWVSSGGSFAFGNNAWHRIGYAPSVAGCIYEVIPTATRIIYPADWNSISCGGDLAYSSGTRGSMLDLVNRRVSAIPYTQTSDAGAMTEWTGNALLNADSRFTRMNLAAGEHVRVAAGTTAAWRPGSRSWTALAPAPAAAKSVTWQWTGTELIGYGRFDPNRTGLVFGA